MFRSIGFAIATCLIPVLAIAESGAPATPAALLESLPPLPASLHGAKCEIGAQMARHAEAIAAEQMNSYMQAAISPSHSPRAVSDAQGDALSQLTDAGITQCIMDVSTQRESIVDPGKQRLQDEANRLQEEMIKADEACGSGIGMNVSCHNRVVRDYKNKMISTAEKTLRDLRAPFGEWQKKTKACLGQRETAVSAVLKSGMQGPFATQALAMRAQSYSLPQLLGTSYTELCEAAVTTGHSLDNQ